MRAFLLCVAISCAVDDGRVDESPLAAQQWYDSLQVIGAKYRKGATQAQSNLRRKQLYVELSERKEERVRMQSTVKGVRWKNGVAEIQASSFLPESDAKAPKSVLEDLPLCDVGASHVGGSCRNDRAGGAHRFRGHAHVSARSLCRSWANAQGSANAHAQPSRATRHAPWHIHVGGLPDND